MEMALVVPFVLIPLLILVVDFGRVFYTYITITNSAREGARLACQKPCTPVASQRAALRDVIWERVQAEAAQGGVAIEDDEITMSPDPVADGCAAAGDTISITVTQSVGTILGGIVGHPTVDMRRTASMVAFGSD